MDCHHAHVKTAGSQNPCRLTARFNLPFACLDSNASAHTKRRPGHWSPHHGCGVRMSLHTIGLASGFIMCLDGRIGLPGQGPDMKTMRTYFCAAKLEMNLKNGIGNIWNAALFFLALYAIGYFVLMSRHCPAVNRREEVVFRSSCRFMPYPYVVRCGPGGMSTTVGRVTAFNYIFYPMDALYYTIFDRGASDPSENRSSLPPMPTTSG